MGRGHRVEKGVAPGAGSAVTIGGQCYRTFTEHLSSCVLLLQRPQSHHSMVSSQPRPHSRLLGPGKRPGQREGREAGPGPGSSSLQACPPGWRAPRPPGVSSDRDGGKSEASWSCCNVPWPCPELELGDRFLMGAEQPEQGAGLVRPWLPALCCPHLSRTGTSGPRGLPRALPSHSPAGRPIAVALGERPLGT